MEILPKAVTVRDLVKNYANNDEEGVVGYDGLLNIRPKYQREYVYNAKQRDAVLDTVKRGLPLNIMYWAKNDDDTYEVLDGQQRTISICDYVNGAFSINFQYFHNLNNDEKNQILDYELMVFEIQGSDTEKLEWFQIVNIAGVKLTDQELRNAVYTGTWLTSAKAYFSKKNGPAYNRGGKDYLRGAPERQDYLEAVLSWAADIDDKKIEDVMAEHQHDADAVSLWDYYVRVINWIEATFTVQRSEMKGVNWGALYNKYGHEHFHSGQTEARIKELLMDDDVTKKSGVYAYVLSDEEKHLSIRAFTPAMKRGAYERQNGRCGMCDKEFELKDMHGDHRIPWSRGGKTTAENCEMLCRDCNLAKGNR